MTTPFVTIAGFAGLGLVAMGLQMLAMWSPRAGTRLHPAQTVLAAAMRSTLGRWIILVLWAWVGWHFFVR